MRGAFLEETTSALPSGNALFLYKCQHKQAREDEHEIGHRIGDAVANLVLVFSSLLVLAFA